MSTQENLNNENKANNGWQNIGICKKFARKNVPAKLRTVWMELVEDSFGYCERKTSQKTQSQMAKDYGFTEKTLREQIKKLEDLKLLSVIHSKHNPKGGGSEAYAYAPTYPKGYGKIYIEDEQKESSNTKSKVPDKKEVTSYKNMYF